MAWTRSRRAIVRFQVERLTIRKAESLEPLDEMHRAYAEATFGAELSQIGRQIWRYQREALNRFLKARRELRTPDGPKPARAESNPIRPSQIERKVAEIIAARNALNNAEPEPVVVASETFVSPISIAPQVPNHQHPASGLARPTSRRNRHARRAAALQQRRD